MSETLEQSAKRRPSSGSYPIGSDVVSQPENLDEIAMTEAAGPRGLVRSIFGWIPSLVVFVGLGGLAWYGHHNDWKPPSFQSTSNTSATGGPAWCDSHGVSEDDCITCSPELIETGPRLKFCNKHGVHGCIVCNPELAQTKTPFEPTEDYLSRIEEALKLRPRKENLPISSSPGTRIQFASIESLNKAGVEVELATRDRVVESVAAFGEIRHDETKAAVVSPQSDGVVKQIAVAVGDWVEAGDLLVLLDSSEAGRLKTQLIAAIADEQLKQQTVERLRPLAGGAVAGKRLLESESAFQQAVAAVNRTVGLLANLGVALDIEDVRKLSGDKLLNAVNRSGLQGLATGAIPEGLNRANLIAITAPLSGQVVSRETTLGEVVDRGTRMFRIVDTRSVWLDLRVPAEEAGLIALGQKTRFQADGSAEWREGSVIWISTESDPETRTVRVRAELENDDQRLRHESFGRGTVVLRDHPDSIVVPESAVQWDGTGHLVFVRDARFFEPQRPKFFVARSVRVGVTQDGMVEIIAGVAPGEVVASTGGDVLRAQLLRSNLGAGCTCGH